MAKETLPSLLLSSSLTIVVYFLVDKPENPCYNTGLPRPLRVGESPTAIITATYTVTTAAAAAAIGRGEAAVYHISSF